MSEFRPTDGPIDQHCSTAKGRALSSSLANETPPAIDHHPGEGCRALIIRPSFALVPFGTELERLGASIRNLHRELEARTLRDAFAIGKAIKKAAVHFDTKE